MLRNKRRFEGRKVQQVGHSTLTVSLPSDWTKAVGLEKGDVVILESKEDGHLVLMPSALVQRRQKMGEFVVNSDLCDEPGMLTRILVGNYVLGRDQTIVRSSGRIRGGHLEEIRAATRILMGFGVIEETPTRIVLQCSIDPEKFPIRTVMRRLHALAMTMVKEATEAFTTFDPEMAEAVMHREEQADTMYWLIVRLLLSAQQDSNIAEKIGLESKLQAIDDRLIAKFLEMIADYSEVVARHVVGISRKGMRVPKAWIDIISELSRLAYAICDEAMECAINGDLKLANNAIEARNVVRSREEQLISQLPSAESDPSAAQLCADLRGIAWGVRRIAEHGAAIAEIAINRALIRPSKICSERQV